MPRPAIGDNGQTQNWSAMGGHISYRKRFMMTDEAIDDFGTIVRNPLKKEAPCRPSV